MSIYPIYPTVIPGTITGLRVSNLASYYFLDNLPAEVLQFAGSGDQLRIYDGSKWKVVTLGAKGTGETLSNEIVIGGDFASSDGWNLQNAEWSISGGKCNKNGSTLNAAYRVISISTGALALVSINITDYTTGKIGCYLDALYNSNHTSTGIKTAYTNITTVGNKYGGAKGGNVNTVASVDDYSVKQVLTPSALGIWYTPVSEESGWDPNAATHTYRLLARRIASGQGGYYK